MSSAHNERFEAIKNKWRHQVNHLRAEMKVVKPELKLAFQQKINELEDRL